MNPPNFQYKILTFVVQEGVEFAPGVSRVLEQRETKFRRLPHFLGVKLFKGANADIVGHTIQPEIQNGGSKTEVPVSRSVYGTNKNFKGYYHTSGHH
jgi:hypothetical protein